MARPASGITKKEAKAALLRSGYLLESRVEQALRQNDYYVEANAAYADPETTESRELDLYALAASKGGPGDLDFVFAVLIVECVNNPQPVAFITKEPQLRSFRCEAIALSGVPVKIPVKGRRNVWQALPDYLGMEHYHHYCQGRVATQYCSFSKKKQEAAWAAGHHEALSESFRKLCAAVDYFVDEHFRNWRFGPEEALNVQLYYPVLVLEGGVLDARPTKRSVTLRPADHLQYRRSAIADGDSREYQIDVVREQFFPEYLEMIEQELAKTVRLLRRRHVVVRDAIDRIVRRAERFRSPDKIRAALDLPT